jgi:hypothetical protein
LHRFVAIKSTADFNCDTGNPTKPEGLCTGRRKIYYSTAHEWATIIYPDNDGPAVADVCYPNFCSKRERSMCGGQGIRSYAFAVRRLRAAAGGVNGSDAGLYNRGTICERNCREANDQGGCGQSESRHSMSTLSEQSFWPRMAQPRQLQGCGAKRPG